MNRSLLCVVTTIVVTTIVVVFVMRRLDDPLRRLESGRGRVTEARLSGLEYSAFRPARGSVQSDSEMLAAVAALQETASRAPTARNLQRYANAELRVGHAADAQQILSRASKADPHDAYVWNDLAVADMALANVFDAAEDAARALECDPTFAAASFNWALSLEKLSNRPEAVVAWRRYLKLDDDSAWATEARQHLARLTSPQNTWEHDKRALVPGADSAVIRQLLGRYPQRMRIWVFDELLPRYVAVRSNVDLSLLETIAAARADLGEPLLLEIANDARRCSPEFALGVSRYAQARAATKDLKLEEAGRMFEAASVYLTRAGSPLALVAVIGAATNANYRGDVRHASELWSQHRDALSQYPTLSAEAKWFQGLQSTQRGDQAEALRLFRDALADAERAHETEHEAALMELVASQLDELADSSEADRSHLEALRRTDGIDAAPQRRYVAYSEAALASLARHRPRVALAFVDAQESIALEAKDPLLLAESQTARAVSLRDCGRSGAAAEAFANARLEAQKIETAALRDRTLAEVEYITASSDEEHASELLSSAIARWKRYGWRYHAAAAHNALGKVFRHRGESAMAESEFRAGIEEMELQRGSLDEKGLKLAYFDRSVLLFEHLTGLLFEEGRIEDAFSVTEQKRARTLLDRFPATRPLEAAEIKAAISPTSALLEIAVGERETWIWLVAQGRIAGFRSPVGGDALAKSVRQQSAAFEANDDVGIHREGKWLYQQLIQPVHAEIPRGVSLVIVPDGALFEVPFASLVAADGTYLMEQHPLSVAPSASIAIQSMTEPAEEAPVLAVAEPAPRDFEVLDHAREEAESLGRAYPNARVYVGSAVSPRDFVRLASDARLVAFSGHARDSALVFESPRGEPASLLQTGDIATSRFRSHPLVVLAACNTGRGNTRPAEGIQSLATAFIAAGARNVVATLWNIDDESSARLFGVFYKNLRAGVAPAEALRIAQVTMARASLPSDRRPSAWAGVVLVGWT